MGSLAKKIEDNKRKQFLKEKTGKAPKHRCPKCHEFTMYRKSEKGGRACVWCGEVF